MRKPVWSVLLLVVVASLALVGCQAAPTPAPLASPTIGPNPTPTLGPVPTPTPSPTLGPA